MRSERLSSLGWLMLVISLSALSLPSVSQEKVRAEVSALNISGFPASITDASLNNLTISSWLEFEASNRSFESVSELYFRVLFYDRNGKFAGMEDGVVTEPLSPGESRRCRVLIPRVVNQYESSFIVLTKTKTTSGVWFINPQEIGESLTANTKGSIELQLPITHETDFTLTAADKSEILSSALRHLLNDPGVKHMPRRTTPLLLRDTCEISSLTIRNAVAQFVTSAELQAIAEKKQRAVFLRCESFQVEGSRVLVQLVLNDLVARGAEKPRVPLRFNYKFICVKRDNKWVVERFFGYS